MKNTAKIIAYEDKPDAFRLTWLRPGTTVLLTDPRLYNKEEIVGIEPFRLISPHTKIGNNGTNHSDLEKAVEIRTDYDDLTRVRQISELKSMGLNPLYIDDKMLAFFQNKANADYAHACTVLSVWPTLEEVRCNNTTYRVCYMENKGQAFFIKGSKEDWIEKMKYAETNFLIAFNGRMKDHVLPAILGNETRDTNPVLLINSHDLASMAMNECFLSKSMHEILDIGGCQKRLPKNRTEWIYLLSPLALEQRTPEERISPLQIPIYC